MTMRSILLVAGLVTVLAACSSSEECSADIDCDDGDFCTQDRCRLERCSYLSIPYCCQTDSDCRDDKLGICNPDTERCVQCLEDRDCPGRCLEQMSVCVECLEDIDCPDGEVCNPEKLVCEPKTIIIGQPCTNDDQCESEWCLTETATAFPGGYCGKSCENHPECSGGLCIDLFTGGKSCLFPCVSDDDCRPEYMCLIFAPGATGCFPHCTEDAHCPSIGSCNEWIGICGVEGPGGEGGAPCQSDQDCKGFCVKETTNGPPGGMCVTICGWGRPACPGVDDRCVLPFSPFLPNQVVCLPAFVTPVTCREGYVPMVAFDFAGDPPGAVGVCQPACKVGDCQDGICNTFTGLCGDTSAGQGVTGDPCQLNEDCQGLCMNFWTNGYCTSPCDPNDPGCIPGSSCMNLGIHQSCGVDCQTDQDCRASDGFFCEPNQKVCVHP